MKNLLQSNRRSFRWLKEQDHKKQSFFRIKGSGMRDEIVASRKRRNGNTKLTAVKATTIPTWQRRTGYYMKKVERNDTWCHHIDTCQWDISRFISVSLPLRCQSVPLGNDLPVKCVTMYHGTWAANFFLSENQTISVLYTQQSWK